MILNSWARKWNIPNDAITELCQMMGTDAGTHALSISGKSEAAIQQELRLEASRKGVRLWRNNVGALKDISGRIVRFGLANDSKRVNEIIKSSDLIGITPHVIVSSDVGGTIGVFTSIECKESNWKYNGTNRENAQLQWIKLILSLGGIAKFATSIGDL